MLLRPLCRYIRRIPKNVTTFHIKLYSTLNREKLTIPEVHGEVAKSILSQLSPVNELLYNISSSPLLEFFLEAKREFPHCLILCKIGAFYEAIGVDAVLLIDHASLTPRCNKPRAGVPVSKLQETLDIMTAAGHSIAIFEECNSRTTDSGSKLRVLAQIVSPENPVYLANIQPLSRQDIMVDDIPPVLAISHSPSDGYRISQIYIAQRRVFHYFNYTLEATISMVENCKPRVAILEGPNAGIRSLMARCIIPNIQTIQGQTGATFHDSALGIVCSRLCITKPFQHVRKSRLQSQMLPLCQSTSVHLGLQQNTSEKTFYSLDECILPKEAPRYCIKFIRQLILNPPPLEICNSIREVVNKLSTNNEGLHVLKPITSERCYLLIESHKANRLLYLDIYSNLTSFLHYCKVFNSKLINNTIKITSYELSCDFTLETLTNNAKKCRKAIESSIKLRDEPIQIPETIPILNGFFESHESFRGVVNDDIMSEYYESIDNNAFRLVYKIVNELCNYIFDSKIRLRSDLPSVFSNKKYDWINFLNHHLRTAGDFIYTKQPVKENASKFNNYNRAVKGAKTTKVLETANLDYLVSVQDAKDKVTKVLYELADSMIPHLPIIRFIGHFNLLLQTLSLHASQGLAFDWSLVKPVKKGVFYLDKFFPFHENPRHSPSELSLTLNGVSILSGPNMSGKSTICRSIVAIAVLSNLGLYAPCGPKSIIPIFDSVVSTSPISHDVPMLGKSLYAQQLNDLACVVNVANSGSLIVADEPCKGSSARSTTVLLAAVAEHLSKLGSLAVLSTHFSQEISELPMESNNPINYIQTRVVNIGMKMCPRWKYSIIPGCSAESGSLKVALQAGIDEKIVNRAKEFDDILKTQNDLIETNYNEREITEIETSETDFTEKEAIERGAGDAISDESMRTDRGASDGTDEKAEKIIQRNSKEECLKAAHQVLEGIIDNSSQKCILSGNQIPPPTFTRRPVVYILFIPIVKNGDPSECAVYVGQTGNISNRISQHRRNGKQRLSMIDGDEEDSNVWLDWGSASAIIAKVGSVHTALMAESEAIRTFQASFPDITLVSTRDRREVSTIEHID